MKQAIDLETALKNGNPVIHSFRGISMYPMLREGKDQVLLKPFTGDNVSLFDVVLFKRKSGEYVLHRVTKMEGDLWEITGDNCINPETVSREQVLGVMEGFFRGREYVPRDNPEYLEYVRKKAADFPQRTVWKPEGATVKYAVKRAFPPLSDMKKKYPVLERAPILLPFCWVRRWFKKGSGKKAIREWKNNRTGRKWAK